MAKNLTLKKILSLDYTDLSKMTKDDLIQTSKVLSRNMNRRMKTLQTKGYSSQSRAFNLYQQSLKSGVKYTTSKDLEKMTRNQMLKQITTAYNIMKLKSATLEGVKKILTGVDKRLADLDSNNQITWSYNDASKAMKDKFWEVYNRITELRNDYDSYQLQKDIAIMFSNTDKRHSAEWYTNRLNEKYDELYKRQQEEALKDLERFNGNSNFFI